MSSTQNTKYFPVSTENSKYEDINENKSNDLLSDSNYYEETPNNSRKGCSFIPMRVVLTILGFLGYINFYTMRVNLSVAMVAMVGQSPRAINGTNGTLETCSDLIVPKNVSEADVTTGLTGEFDWDSEIQGQVLGSFFYGYLITQIPGGVLAEKVGGKWICGFGILITSIFTLLTPIAARWSVWSLVAARAIEGLASGVVCPSMTVLIGRWVPKNERSRITTAMSMGIMVGTVITNPVTGILCESTLLGGWPSAFYIFGSFGCVWFLLWSVLVYDTPETHPFISKREQDYILKNIDKTSTTDISVPWKSIWTSPPVWALILAHFGHNWAFYTLMTMIPTYLSNVLHFELKSNGLMSGLPWLMMAICSITASFIADSLRASGRLRITAIRKLMASIGLFGPACCVFSIAFIGCKPVAIVAVLCLSFGLNGLVFSGIIVNHVDMSPQFAGTLFGITNCIGTLPGFLAPTLIGLILKSGQSLENWGIVFMMTSGIYLAVGIVYDIFASAELQPWNSTNKEKDTKRLPAPATCFPAPTSYNVKYSGHHIPNGERSDILRE